MLAYLKARRGLSKLFDAPSDRHLAIHFSASMVESDVKTHEEKGKQIPESLMSDSNRYTKNMDKIDFRLYVDGDFSNIKDLKNWMELLKNTPKINSYGYSKSLNLFLQLSDNKYKFPTNYALNLSNGGIYDSLKPFLINLPFVRGNFTAIKSTKKDIRKQFKNKVFICGGDCGNCTKIGHACGDMSTFKNMEIVIPIH